MKEDPHAGCNPRDERNTDTNRLQSRPPHLYTKVLYQVVRSCRKPKLLLAKETIRRAKRPGDTEQTKYPTAISEGQYGLSAFHGYRCSSFKPTKDHVSAQCPLAQLHQYHVLEFQ